MKLLCVIFLAASSLAAAGQQSQAGASTSSRTAATAAPVSETKAQPAVYHVGPWEQEIGYAQAVRVGNTIYVSGTVGVGDNGVPSELDGQMQRAYAGIQKTLAHYGASLSNVVMERIQTTDMDALIQAQETRKKIYGDWVPAATWIEVKRLYLKEAKIEIDVQARID